MPLYDLFLLLDPNAPDERRSSILDNVRQRIESGGELVGAHEWGTRRMTFEIDHRPDAEYHIIQFKAESTSGGLLDDLDHNLKITDGLLRHRIIKLKDGSPPPPAPRPDRPPREEGGYQGRDREAVPAGVGAGSGDAVQEVAAAQTAPAPTETVPADVAPTEAAPMDAPPAEAPAPVEAPAPAADAPAPAEAPAPAADAPADLPAADAPEQDPAA